MSTKFKSQMKEVMSLAWQFVRKNGYSMSEALKCAWANLKLKAALKVKIVEFYFKKTDGTLRQAFGLSKRILSVKRKVLAESRMIICKCIGTQRKKNTDVSRSVTLLKSHDNEKEKYGNS